MPGSGLLYVISFNSSVWINQTQHFELKNYIHILSLCYVRMVLLIHQEEDICFELILQKRGRMCWERPHSPAPSPFDQLELISQGFSCGLWPKDNMVPARPHERKGLLQWSNLRTLHSIDLLLGCPLKSSEQLYRRVTAWTPPWPIRSDSQGVQHGLCVKFPRSFYARVCPGRLPYQCFSNLDVHTSHLRILLRCRFWCCGSGVQPRVCISHQWCWCCWSRNHTLWVARWLGQGPGGTREHPRTQN